MPTPPDACSGCKYWRRNDPVAGECRYEAPKPQPVPAPGVAGRFGVWPLTMAEAWCGRFEARKDGA